MTRIGWFLTLIIGVSCASVNWPWEQTIEASVVAYDKYRVLAKITSAPQVDLLIVKLDKRSRQGGTGRVYKKIVLMGFHGDPLPSELFQPNNLWLFSVSVSQSSENCSTPTEHLKWLAEEAELSESDLIDLECLEANRSDLKRITRRNTDF